MKKRNNISQTNGWEFDIVEDLEDIERIRPIWETMQHKQSSAFLNPNVDIDRYLSIIEPIKDIVQPYIILLYRNCHPEVLIIGRKETVHIKCKIGYLTLLKPSLRSITILYRGVLGQLNSDSCSMLFDVLNRSLCNGQADVAVFNHLSIDSQIYQLVQSTVSFLRRGHFPVLDKHWKVSLPNSYEEFLHTRSKNTRHNIRRYSKRLASKYGDRLSIKCFTRANQIDQLFKDTVEVAETTYQHSLGAAFIDDIKTRSLINLFIDRELLVAYLLYIDGKPCAFWHGIRYGKAFFTTVTGYDPAYNNDRLGMFLLIKIFESLCQDKSINTVDFGFGDAQYKESFSDTSWMETSLYIFAPRLYPIMVNGLHSLVTGLFLGMSSLVRKIGFEHWVKRRWRNLLQANKTKSKM